VTTAGQNNRGSGLIASPQLADARHEWATASFSVRFEEDAAGGLQYVVSGRDGSGQPIAEQPPVPYDPASGQLEFKNAQGVALRVTFSGQPQAQDTFAITSANAASAATDGEGVDLNIFHTLDALVEDLRLPAYQSKDAAVQARLGNTLNSAMQKIDLNYDQLLSIRASVGTRLNEIDALDLTGQQRNLNWEGRLSQMENVDYYTAISQLQLRKTALEAAAAAFKQIQSTSLFNMGN